VFHKEHHLPREVTLLEDATFPGCSQCDRRVQFQFIRKIEIDPEGFVVTLHQIPPITAAQTTAKDDQEERAA
jgi:hypothetical protein